MTVKLSTDDAAYPVTIDLDVRMVDTFGGEHLGNHAIVAYANEGMMKLYEMLGFRFGIVGGTSYIQREMNISYHSEASYLDKIRIYTAIETFEEKQYAKVFRLYNLTRQQEVSHMRGWYCSFDYKTRKTVAVPEKLKQAYASLAGE